VVQGANGGASWNAINSGLGDYRCACSDTNPSTPTTIYAGTSGRGVFESTNGWTWIALITAWVTKSFNRSPLISVPHDTLRQRDSAACLRQTDGGANWNVIGNGLPGNVNGCRRWPIDSHHPTTVYAGTGGRGAFVLHQGTHPQPAQ